jgi:hypothetical protein
MIAAVYRRSDLAVIAITKRRGTGAFLCLPH